jgi:hypothetical protein
MTRSLILFILTFLAIDTYAQHCPYDGRTIIMVKLKYDTSRLEDKFNVVLLDSAGNIITKSKYQKSGDTAYFWKTPPKDSKRKWEEPQTEHFSFAKDNYYLYTDPRYPYHTSPLKVKVEYRGKGKNKKGSTKVYGLPKEAVLPLCTARAEVWYKDVEPVVLEFKL